MHVKKRDGSIEDWNEDKFSLLWDQCRCSECVKDVPVDWPNFE